MCCYLPFKSALTDWPLTFDAVKHNKFLEFKHFNHVFSQSENYVVPERGLEPPHLSIQVPKTCASANSATRAN